MTKTAFKGKYPMKAAVTAVPLQFVAFCPLTVTNRRPILKAARQPPFPDPSRPFFGAFGRTSQTLRRAFPPYGALCGLARKLL